MWPTIEVHFSAMIFTIMGIWIAYVYPNAVLRVVQPSKIVVVLAEEDIKRVRMLVGVVILSASILALLVIGVASKSFIVKTNSFVENTTFYTCFGLWGLLILTYTQLFCIYAVITLSVNFIFDLKNLEAKKKLSEKLDGKKSAN